MAARRLFSTSSRVFREFLVSKPGMFAKVIDGKAIGAAVRREVREEIQELVSGGRTLTHAICTNLVTQPGIVHLV